MTLLRVLVVTLHNWQVNQEDLPVTAMNTLLRTALLCAKATLYLLQDRFDDKLYYLFEHEV